MIVVRPLLVASGLMLLTVSGCGSKDPGAGFEAPVIAENAPSSSEEASKQLDADIAKQEASERAERRASRQREY